MSFGDMPPTGSRIPIPRFSSFCISLIADVDCFCGSV